LNDLEGIAVFLRSVDFVLLLLIALDYGMTSGQIVCPSRCNDEALRRIMNIVGMPDRMAENLVRFIH
jgi:hypothetical protein